jgi:hypothetical protein
VQYQAVVLSSDAEGYGGGLRRIEVDIGGQVKGGTGREGRGLGRLLHKQMPPFWRELVAA